MIALKRLLVPTDFSESSAVALRYAKSFAQAFGASMHILHVIEVKTLAYGEMAAGTLPPFDVEPVLESIEQDARDRLEKELTPEERVLYRAELVTHVGTAFLEIIRYARAEDIDLIIMGTHGRSFLAHVLLGTVAERVVRKAPCPVLTVRHPQHEFVMP